MDNTTGVLLQYGLAGVAIIAESSVIIRLYNDNRSLQKEKDAIQEARRGDAVETRNAVTSILPGITQSLQNISDKIEISQQVRVTRRELILLSPAISTTSGNLIVACVVGRGPATPFTFTDSVGLTWTKSAESDDGTNSATIFYSKNITGNASHTFTADGANGTFQNLIIYEISGIDGTSPLDQVDATTGLNSDPITTTQADEIIVMCGENNGSALTVGSGFSNFVATTGGGGLNGAGQTKIVSSIQSNQSYSFGGSPSQSNIALSTFKAGTSSGGGATGNFLGFLS